MTKRVTIDPVTRIEGHLRVDVEVNGGKVTKAWSSGQMWRGVENILIGRDPATPGPSPSASAACAPPSTPSVRCGPWRMR